MLHEAALKEEVDPVDGVSPCILAGKVAKLGSNTVTVMKDLVVEKKYKVDPPKEEEGADMWMPIPNMCPSPTYDPGNMWGEWNTGRPASPTYMP